MNRVIQLTQGLIISKIILFYILLISSPIANAQTATIDSVQVEWIRQYISPYIPNIGFVNAIAVDGSDNIIVIGSSWGSNQLPDIITIKYNNIGDTLWVRRWNGPGNSWDVGRALAVDAAGNIYVTGETHSDSTLFDYVTIKYDAAGNRLWEAIYDGPLNGEDASRDIAVDGSGNVYVIGHISWEVQNRTDFATIKYNSSGQQQWVKRYNGPGSQADFGVGIALDQAGNVYVTGTDDDLSVTHFPAYATVKYNSNGDEQWVRRYQEYWTYAADIDVDVSGNVVVTGRSYGQGTGYDYATVKYNSAGAQQWVKRYNGPGTSDDYALAIDVDASGNVYVTGEAFFMVNEGSDYATIKYSPSGVQQWVARYNGPGSSVDVANDITVDNQGNVYVTGESRNAAGDDDFATIKYSPTGAEQWVVRYNGSGDTFDHGKAIAVDASSNVYVTGESVEIGERTITTIKYTEVLVPVELTSFTANVDANVVTLNWVTASEINNQGFEIHRLQDSKIEKLQDLSAGQAGWSVIGFVNGNGTTTETSVYSFTDEVEAGKPALPAGRYYYRLKQIDFDGTFEYSNEIEVDVLAPQEFILSQNYPNPFNPSTVIKYSVPEASFVSLAVYNVLGQRVDELVNELNQAGVYEVNFNAAKFSSGVYYYRLKAGNFISIKKMVLLK